MKVTKEIERIFFIKKIVKCLHERGEIGVVVVAGRTGIEAETIWWSRCNRKSATHEALLWREIAGSVQPMSVTEEGSK